MTISTNQQNELQTLAGRTLTSTEITMANNRQDGSLAASLSVGLTEKASISAMALDDWLAANNLRGMIEDAAKTSGSTFYATRRSQALAILDIIQANISLDISSSATGQANLAMLNAWATPMTGETAAPLTSAQVAALIALGTVVVTISTDQVSTILNGA